MPSFLHHHLHHGHPDEFTQILRSRNLRAFGNSIATTFISLYLITTYGGLREALWPISVFVLSAYMLRVALMPLFAEAVVRFGAKHVMAASYLLSAAALLMVAFLQTNVWWIAAFGLLVALGNGMFFIAYHIDLALTLNRGNSVKHGVGSVQMVRKVSLALGPLVGGIIATQVDEKSLFLLAAAITGSAAVALYLGDDDVVSHRTKLKFNAKKFYRKHRKALVASFGMGVNSGAAMFLWSILLFVVIGTYQAVGVVVAASLILSLVVITINRRHESFDSDNKEIKGGSRATAAIHVARPFADTATLATGVSFFNDLAYTLLFVPYVDRYYKQIRSGDGLTFVAAMEAMVCIGRIINWFSFVILFLLFGQFWGFFGAFMFASVSTLFIQMINQD